MKMIACSKAFDINTFMPRKARPPFKPRAESIENPRVSFQSWFDTVSYSDNATYTRISEATAMTLPAVYACVTLLSDITASIPLIIYKRDPSTGLYEDAQSHRLQTLFRDSPNAKAFVSPFSWLHNLKAFTLLYGNSYDKILTDGAGRVTGFQRLEPWNVSVFRHINGQNRVYKYFNPTTNSTEIMQDKDVLHFSGPGFDGLKSPSRIQAFARDALFSDAIYSEENRAAHQNASRPSGVVTVQNSISDKGMQRLNTSMQQRYSGAKNVGKWIVVDEATKFTQLQITPQDLNTIEQMRLSAQRICSFFRVPPHLVGDAESTTSWGSGIAEISQGFLQYTLEPEFRAIETELNLKLFLSSDFFIRFDRDALLIMDALTKNNIINSQIQSGRITLDEARRIDNRQDYDDGSGKTALINGNMIPVKVAASKTEAQPPKPNADPNVVQTPATANPEGMQQ